MISDWVHLSLDPSSFADTETKDGASISTSPSPYDIPEAVRANYDQTRKHLAIEFQYIGEEPLRKVPEEPGVSFKLGKNSDRIYGIDLDLNRIEIGVNPIEAITGHVTRTINILADHQHRPARQFNYTMARQAVDSEKNNLFSSVIGVLAKTS